MHACGASSSPTGINDLDLDFFFFARFCFLFFLHRCHMKLSPLLCVKPVSKISLTFPLESYGGAVVIEFAVDTPDSLRRNHL